MPGHIRVLPILCVVVDAVVNLMQLVLNCLNVFVLFPYGFF
jgi:hypothetical protein